MSLKVKFNGTVGLAMYHFLIIYNNNRMYITHHLAVTNALKYFPFPLPRGQNFAPDNIQLHTPRQFSQTLTIASFG